MRNLPRWFPILLIVSFLALFLVIMCSVASTASAGGGTIYRATRVDFGQPTHLPVSSGTVHLTKVTLESSLSEVIHVHKLEVGNTAGVDMDITLRNRQQVPLWYPTFPSTYIEGFKFSVPENPNLGDVTWNVACLPGPTASIVQINEVFTTTVSLGIGAEQVLYALPMSTTVGSPQKLDAHSPSFSAAGESGSIFLLTQPPVAGKLSSNDVCATVVWGPPQVKRTFFLPLVARGR